MAISSLDNAALCLQALREHDVDRYLASLLSPPEKRRALVALYAYHAELARVRDSVREPLPGEMRLQYWRDLLVGSEHGSTGPILWLPSFRPRSVTTACRFSR